MKEKRCVVPARPLDIPHTRPAPTRQTWNTPWSTPPSSKSIATDRAQKGDSEPALGNLVRFVLLPGHRFDTVGVAPLIDGLAFDGFIADKALDSNSIIAYLNERGAKIVISQHPRRASPLPIDAEIYK